MNPSDIRILFVDGDPDGLAGTARLLEKAGYTVDRAASGEGALLAAQNHRPDLLLLDHHLPGLNGTEVCRRIKQDPALADSLVVIVSADHAESDQQAEGLELGVDGYIGRPIGNRELLARVQSYVRIQRLTRSLRLQTEELKQSNAAAHQAHRATLNLMADAVEARDRLEISNQALQSENTARKLAEAAREEALSRLQKIASRVPGAVYQFCLRPEGTTSMPYASDGLREIYRISPEAVREDAAPLFACHHPDDHASILASIQQSARDLTPWRHEYRVRFADGTVRWLAGNSLPQRESDGTTLWHGFITDITERRQAEVALRESHGMIVKLTSQVPGVVYQYRVYPDGSSAFPFASPGMNDIYEVSPEAVREDATPVFGRLHPDDHDRIVADIQESARTLQLFHCEFRVVLPRQGLRWRLCDASPERMEDGGTLWHGIISDITERRLAEVALRESEAKLHSVIDCSPVPLAMNDEAGNITYVNREFTKTFGYELGDIPTLAAWWQKAYPEPTYQAEVKTQWQLRLNQALQERKSFEPVEVNIRCQDGAQRIALVGAAALTFPSQAEGEP